MRRPGCVYPRASRKQVLCGSRNRQGCRPSGHRKHRPRRSGHIPPRIGTQEGAGSCGDAIVELMCRLSTCRQNSSPPADVGRPGAGYVGIRLRGQKGDVEGCVPCQTGRLLDSAPWRSTITLLFQAPPVATAIAPDSLRYFPSFFHSGQEICWPKFPRKGQGNATAPGGEGQPRCLRRNPNVPCALISCPPSKNSIAQRSGSFRRPA